LPADSDDRCATEQPVADRLFAVAEGVYRVALPTSFAVGDVNAYFIDGPRPALIDCGVAGKPTLQCLAQALGHIGRSIADIRILLLSHTHVDHAGSANAVRAQSGAEILLHPRGHERLSDIHADAERSAAWYSAFFGRAGFSADVIARHAAVSTKLERYAESCPVLGRCVEGDEIDLGASRRIVVHESFGHTTNHLSYWLEDARLLFTGDHVLQHISPNPTLEPPGGSDRDKPLPLVLYQESLERLGRLPARLACPGHGTPFAGLGARATDIRAHQRRRCQQVLEMLHESGGMTLKELSLALFGSVPLWEIYLTVSEAHAAVELLESEGSVRRSTLEGIDHFTTIKP